MLKKRDFIEWLQNLKSYLLLKTEKSHPLSRSQLLITCCKMNFFAAIWGSTVDKDGFFFS